MVKKLILLIFATFLFAAIVPPDESWSYQETKHFRIYFSKYTQPFVDKVADLAENAYLKVTKEIGYDHRDRIELVIASYSDDANGYAAYFFNTVVLNIAPTSTQSLGPFREHWLSNLLVHELTHIVHMSINYSSDFLYSMSRQLSAKGAFYPFFLLEGYAIYNEKKLAKGGRLLNSYFNEYMFAFAKDNDFPKLGQISHSNMLRFPQGNGGYIIGAKFVEYLANKYGDAKLVSSFHVFSKEIRSSYSQAFYSIYKSPIAIEYQDFIDSEKAKLLPTKNYQYITADGGYSRSPKWATRQKIYYYKNDLHRRPGIYSLDLVSGVDKLLYQDKNLKQDYYLHNDSLYILKVGLKDTYRDVTSLYHVDLRTKHKTLIDDHVYRMNGSEDNLIYVKNYITYNALIKYDTTTKKREHLLKFEYIDQVAIWSNRCAYVKRVGAVNGVYLMNIDTYEEKEVAIGNVRDLLFENGDLYFVSDWTGYSNLYHYISGRIEQISDVYTGVYDPDVYEGNVVFSTLTSKGFKLVTDSVKIVTANFKIPAQTNSTQNALESHHSRFPISDSPNYAEKDFVKSIYSKDWFLNNKKSSDSIVPYNMFNLNLQFFVPFLAFGSYGESVGFSTMLSDPLQYQQAMLYFYQEKGLEMYDFQYLNTMKPIWFKFNAKKDYFNTIESYTFYYPNVQGDLQHQLYIGYQNQTVSKDKVPAYLVGYSLQSIDFYPYSISLEKGFINDITGYYDIDNSKYSVLNNFNAYFPAIGLNHVLKLNIELGYSQVDDKFYIGGFPHNIYIRGYSFGDYKKGSQLFKGITEYRLPLWQIDDEWLFFYLRQISGVFFVDFGAVSNSRETLFDKPMSSVGAMFKLQVTGVNVMAIEFSIGYAFTRSNDQRIIFTFESKF